MKNFEDNSQRNFGAEALRKENLWLQEHYNSTVRKNKELSNLLSFLKFENEKFIEIFNDNHNNMGDILEVSGKQAPNFLKIQKFEAYFEKDQEINDICKEEEDREKSNEVFVTISMASLKNLNEKIFFGMKILSLEIANQTRSKIKILDYKIQGAKSIRFYFFCPIAFYFFKI